MARWSTRSVASVATAALALLVLAPVGGAASAAKSECPAPPAREVAVDATPGATPTPPEEPVPLAPPDPALAVLDEPQAREADLPPGVPADPATVEAITALEEAFVACYNAGELLRLTDLMTEQGKAETIASYERYPDSAARLATPTPFRGADRIRELRIRDVRLLPDGRAGAIVDWDGEENFRIYEFVDGRWLIADEIFIYGFG